MLYEVITPARPQLAELRTLGHGVVRALDALLALARALEGRFEIVEVASAAEVDRITSYNVCYTKLLRMDSRQISKTWALLVPWWSADGIVASKRSRCDTAAETPETRR